MVFRHVCCQGSAFVLYCRERLGKDSISIMSERLRYIHLAKKKALPWWIRFCRWLWKHPLPFLWCTLLINISINIGSAWLITPANTQAIPDTSLVGRTTAWIETHWQLSCLLLTISA